MADAWDAPAGFALPPAEADPPSPPDFGPCSSDPDDAAAQANPGPPAGDFPAAGPASDLSGSVPEPGAAAVAMPVLDAFPRVRARVRFRKEDLLRFIGHQDLMRLWHRLLRRTGLPIRFTEGFHPKPALSSPSALPLGLEGHDEVMEFELSRPVPFAEVVSLLVAEADPGLAIVGVAAVPRAWSSQVVSVEYRVPLGAAADDLAGLAAALDRLLASPELTVTRRVPDKPVKTMDLRPYLVAGQVAADGLVLSVKVTPAGTARLEELLRLLGPIGPERWPAPAAVLARSRVELADDERRLAPIHLWQRQSA